MTFERTNRLPIAVLISGSGRTLLNFLELSASGKLDVDVRLVISSSPKAGGLDHARDAGVPTLVVEQKSFDSGEAFSEAVFRPCREAGVDYVVMAGYLKLLPVPTDFENRVTNIHPALIPAFCGKGLYGHHVHEAVLASGVKESGCTVHFVDNQYDHGPIILQRRVPVLDGDTPDSLADRVFEAESLLYPDVLSLLAAGRVVIEEGRVRLLKDDNSKPTHG